MRNLLLVVFLIGACAADPVESSTEQDIAKGDLTKDGYTCTNVPTGGSKCGKCWIAVFNGVSEKVCVSYTCDASGACTWDKTWYPDATLESDLNYWFEVEDATFTGSAGIASDGGASRGACLSLAGGYSTKTFYAGIPGTLTAWVRVLAPSTTARSFYLQLDTVSQRFEVPVSTAWTWVPLHTSQYVGVGYHTFQFFTDVVGVKIDRILFTDNTQFTPTIATQQAETAALVAPMQIGSIRTIPITSYIYVPNGAGSGGRAQLQIAEPSSGTYTVWGRTSAATTADNSFGIGMLGDAPSLWDLSVGSSWAWNHAPGTYAFDTGAILEVTEQEDGAKLDKLLYTNDPGFVPVESSPVVIAQ